MISGLTANSSHSVASLTKCRFDDLLLANQSSALVIGRAVSENELNPLVHDRDHSGHIAALKRSYTLRRFRLS
jgi:hypothetical protein